MIDPDQLRQHLRALDSGDETSRREAIRTLRHHKEEDWADVPAETAKSLVKALQHQFHNGTKQTFLRQEISIILGNLGTRAEPAIPQLMELLSEGVPDGIREEAATALGKIGKKSKPAVAPMLEMLPNCRTTLAVRIILALNDIVGADRKVRSALVDLWQAPDQSQVNQVQIALALCKLKIDARNLVPFLTRTVVANPDANLRRLSAEALGSCSKNDTDVVPALLLCALNDKDEKIRPFATTALTQLKLTNEKAVVVCARQLKASIYAETALKKSGVLAVAPLVEALTDSDPIVREKAARILSSFGEVAVAAGPALTKLLRDKEAEVRLAAAKALWNITKSADVVVPVLVELIEEKGKPTTPDLSEARRQFLQTAIEALWRMGPLAKAAVPALTKKTRDKNRLVSESAVNALKDIAPAVALKK